jgi:excisionase family DNA binding protein
MESEQGNWFTTKEAANYIGVTPTTLYTYLKMRKGRPPFFRLAGRSTGRLRFPKQAFIQWANGSYPKQGQS